MDRRVWLLAAAQFAAGTGAYAFTGLLAGLAADLGVSVGTAGQLAAAYALTLALAGVPAAALTARVDRRVLLTIGLGAASLANLAGALVPDFGSALALRVLAGLAGTLVLPGVAATMLVRPEERGRALAIVLSGLTFAFSLGVPFGTAIGAWVGWRGTFAFAGVLTGLAAVGVWVGLPRLPSTDRGGALALGIGLRRDILLVLATVLLSFAGLFCVAAYIGPIVTATTGMTGAGIAGVQAFIGLGSIGGIALGGRLAGRHGPMAPMWLSALLAAALLGYAALLLLPPALWHAAPLAGCIFAGSVALFALAPMTQAKLVGLAPGDRAVALALMASVASAGQGAGAAVGGAVTGAVGLVGTGVAGCGLALLGAAVAVRAFRVR